MKQYYIVLIVIVLILAGCEDRQQYIDSTVVIGKSDENLELPVTSQADETPQPVVFDPIIAVNTAVEDSYFSDAVFIGDSISEGITLYKPIDDATVLAATGINPSSIFTTPVIKQEDGTRITILDALKEKQAKKIYIMLGANGINFIPIDKMIEDYQELLLQIKQEHPDAIIYVQSVLPVTKENKYNISNEDINFFNEQLIQLCAKEQVYYLDISSDFKTADGTLPIETSPTDGMHFGKRYYSIWFDFLKAHTLEGAVFVDTTISDVSQTSELPEQPQLSS